MRATRGSSAHVGGGTHVTQPWAMGAASASFGPFCGPMPPRPAARQRLPTESLDLFPALDATARRLPQPPQGLSPFGVASGKSGGRPASSFVASPGRDGTAARPPRGVAPVPAGDASLSGPPPVGGERWGAFAPSTSTARGGRHGANDGAFDVVVEDGWGAQFAPAALESFSRSCGTASGFRSSLPSRSTAAVRPDSGVPGQNRSRTLRPFHVPSGDAMRPPSQQLQMPPAAPPRSALIHDGVWASHGSTGAAFARLRDASGFGRSASRR